MGSNPFGATNLSLDNYPEFDMLEESLKTESYTNMIERANAFVVGEVPFLTLEAAQAAELTNLFPTTNDKENPSLLTVKEIVAILMENQEQVLDILTTTPTSKPKARKINGGSKPRKNKVLDATSLSPTFGKSTVTAD